MFDPDLFISWLAEQVTGRLPSLIRNASWASGRERQAVTRWLSRVEALGALTIDWREGLWRSNPCEITDLPGRIQTAVLNGARPASPGFYRQQGAVVQPQHAGPDEIPLPAAVWLQYTEPSGLNAFAAAAGAAVVPCAAENAARSLMKFIPGPPSAPPARDSTAELLDPVTGRFRPVSLAGHRFEPGLYKYTLFGQLHRYALLRGPSRQPAAGNSHHPAALAEQTWHVVDRRAGIHQALRPQTFPLRWKADPGAGRTRRYTPGRLTVSRLTPLPLAQEHAAVLCTGLAALRTMDAEHYDGVPFFIADRIACTLHRRLETT
ncbi:hypothetical protein ACFYS7_35125 [Streptomyces avermitilis]|uniref:hypothetical protein n=1 Tax=Streptomyces avermitilis TaxID=33903 RepID=UPI003674F798